MLIRPASEKDAKNITHIWNPMIRDTENTFTSTQKTVADVQTMIAQRAKHNHGFYVAQNDAGILGFATYFPFRSGPGYAHTMEHSVILAPNAVGKGLGRSLMDRLEDHARDNQIHVMIAGISAQNTTAQLFHKAIGYQQVAHIKQVGFKFGSWHDLILMQKFM